MAGKHTKEGVAVEVGQVWRDLDRRMNRTVTVIEVRPDARPHPYARVVSSAGVKSQLRISRMHKHATGFELIATQPLPPPNEE